MVTLVQLSMVWLWNGRYIVQRRSHSSETIVQPLERSVQVDFDPTRCSRYILSMILCTPSFDKWQADRAHFCKSHSGLKARVHDLIEQIIKFIAVKQFQLAVFHHFANCARGKVVQIICHLSLNKYRWIRQALENQFVVSKWDAHALSNVFSCCLDLQTERKFKSNNSLWNGSFRVRIALTWYSRCCCDERCSIVPRRIGLMSMDWWIRLR